MPYIKDFQHDNNKHNLQNRDRYNPEFNPTVSSIGKNQQKKFNKAIDNYIRFVSWGRWYPDLFLDLITPKEGTSKAGKIKLGYDQRVFLRCILRFFSIYGVFPRGYSKTWTEVLAMIITCIFYPNIQLALTAQTKEASAKMLSEKVIEICRQYPLIDNEIVKKKSSKDDAEYLFSNGSCINILANSQSSKGSRRKRISIEEAALLNNETFEDALAPIVEIGRNTCGALGIVDPCELNQKIDFYTTSGFMGSTEHTRNIEMYKSMINLEGKIVLGSDWKLACWYGRGSSKDKILKKKKTSSPTYFAMNFESKWVGSVSNQLVDINTLYNQRTLRKPILSNDTGEVVLGVDVARSQNEANNKTIISVLRIQRNSNNTVKKIELGNMFTISNKSDYETQAVCIKRTQVQYNAKMVVIDANGVGSGVVDELLKPNVDKRDGVTYPAWNSAISDYISTDPDAPVLFYPLKANGINTQIIISFINSIDSGKLVLLENKKETDFNTLTADGVSAYIPYEQTNAFIAEVANLKIKQLPGGNLTVEQVVRKVDKDRYSSVAYGIYWIMTYDNIIMKDDVDILNIVGELNQACGSIGSSLGNIFK